jgi:hypothetical protein
MKTDHDGVAAAADLGAGGCATQTITRRTMLSVISTTVVTSTSSWQPDANILALVKKINVAFIEANRCCDRLDAAVAEFNSNRPHPPVTLSVQRGDWRLFSTWPLPRDGFYTDESVNILRDISRSGCWKCMGTARGVEYVEDSELRRRVEEIILAYDRWDRASCRLYRRLGIPDLFKQAEAHDKFTASLLRDLHGMRATTIEGLIAKARVFRMSSGGDDLDYGYIEGIESEENLMRSIVRDLIQPTPPSPAAPAVSLKRRYSPEVSAA